MEGVGRHKVGRLSQLLRGYKEIKKKFKNEGKKGSKIYSPTVHMVFIFYYLSVLRSRSYLQPGGGAGAEIIFLINIYCSQFEGC